MGLADKRVFYKHFNEKHCVYKICVRLLSWILSSLKRRFISPSLNRRLKTFNLKKRHGLEYSSKCSCVQVKLEKVRFPLQTLQNLYENFIEFFPLEYFVFFIRHKAYLTLQCWAICNIYGYTILLTRKTLHFSIHIYFFVSILTFQLLHYLGQCILTTYLHFIPTSIHCQCIS